MIQFKRQAIKLSMAILLGLSFMSCKKEDDEDPQQTNNIPTVNFNTPSDQDDIVDVALSNPSFDSLVVALTRAELVSTFQGDNSGPFTVFAPTNDAFVNLLSDLNYNSISEIDKGFLTEVLTFHVVSGKVLSTDLSDGMLAKTLQGNTFTINTSGGVTIDVNSSDKMGVNVTQADVKASNGVIHVIDAILVPDLKVGTPSDDIIDIALANDFDSLAVALTKAGLVSTFQGDDSGPFTVFAPTNQAFVDLLGALNLGSIAEIDDALLTSVLQAHVVDGVFQQKQISNNKSISTLGGAPITFDATSGVTVSSASTTGASVTSGDDVWATNGVIHIINKVLVP